MIAGEIDLDRAIWDPEYRWRVLQFLNSEAAGRRRPANDDGSDPVRPEGPGHASTASSSRKTGRTGP